MKISAQEIWKQFLSYGPNVANAISRLHRIPTVIAEPVSKENILS